MFYFWVLFFLIVAILNALKILNSDSFIIGNKTGS